MGRRSPALADVGAGKLPPAPWALSGCALVGLLAVLALPEVASVLPWGDRPEPNEAQLAVVAMGVLIVTAFYLYSVHGTTA